MCFVEIALTVFGIVVLATGKVKWVGGKEVNKGAAYLVGALLTATFPLALLTGFVLGAVLVQQGHAPEKIQDMAMKYWYIDVVLVAVILVFSGVITGLTAKEPFRPQYGQQPYGPQQYGQPQYPPADPNNPYQSPHAGGGFQQPGPPQQQFPQQPQPPQQQWPPPGNEWPPKDQR